MNRGPSADLDADDAMNGKVARVHLRAAVSTVRKGFGTNRKPKRPEVVAVEAMQERVKERNDARPFPAGSAEAAAAAVQEDAARRMKARASSKSTPNSDAKTGGFNLQADVHESLFREPASPPPRSPSAMSASGRDDSPQEVARRSILAEEARLLGDAAPPSSPPRSPLRAPGTPELRELQSTELQELQRSSSSPRSPLARQSSESSRYTLEENWRQSSGGAGPA